MSEERIPVFWDATPCRVVSICRSFEGYQYVYLHLHGPKNISMGTDIVRYLMCVCPCIVDDMRTERPTRCYTI